MVRFSRPEENDHLEYFNSGGLTLHNLLEGLLLTVPAARE